jgi:hypothetical protein
MGALPYMEAWTARDSWHIQRVGDGGNQNGIDILVECPVLSIFGPLTPDSVRYLGKEGDGFRSRWLVHLVEGRADMFDAGPQPDSWTLAISELWEAREVRQWELTGAANNRYQQGKNRWREQQSEPQPQSVIEALRILGKTPWQSAGGPEDPREPLAPRQLVPYICDRGHTFEVCFAAGITVPTAWDCRCGKPAELTAALEVETEHQRRMPQVLGAAQHGRGGAAAR